MVSIIAFYLNDPSSNRSEWSPFKSSNKKQRCGRQALLKSTDLTKVWSTWSDSFSSHLIRILSLIFLWQMEKSKQVMMIGQWLWLSWKTSRFQCQRSAVGIESSAYFYIEHLFTVNYIQKTKNEKQAGNGPFFKKVLIICIKRIVIFRFSAIPGGERRPRVEGSVQKVPQKHQRALNSAKRNPIFVPERPLLKRQIKP